MVSSRVTLRTTAKKHVASVLIAAVVAVPPSHQLPQWLAQISVRVVAAIVHMACQRIFVIIPGLEAAVASTELLLQYIARKCATSAEANIKKQLMSLAFKISPVQFHQNLSQEL